MFSNTLWKNRALSAFPNTFLRCVMDSKDDFMGVVPKPPKSSTSSRGMPEWFRKHRVATKKLPPSLKATSSLVASTKQGGKAAGAASEEYKVDHNNTPYRWKDKVTLEKEKIKQETTLRKKAHAVKRFPGILNSNHPPDLRGF